MNQTAPLACPVAYPAACGRPIYLCWESWDAVSNLYVGKLVCAGGHDWIDMRSDDVPRRHLWRGQGRLPFTEKRSRKMHPTSSQDT